MVFARRDGHHTRQPETIQEFPGGSRPSLHKMSSLSVAVHLGELGGGGFSPFPTLRLTPNWFLITDFSPARGRETWGGGQEADVEGNQGLGTGGDAGVLWRPDPGAPRCCRGQGFSSQSSTKLVQGGRDLSSLYATAWPTSRPNEI